MPPWPSSDSTSYPASPSARARSPSASANVRSTAGHVGPGPVPGVGPTAAVASGSAARTVSIVRAYSGNSARGRPGVDGLGLAGAVFPIEGQQLAEQDGPRRAVGLAEEVAEVGPLAAAPGGLEAVAHRVDGPPLARRQGLGLGRRRGPHRETSSTSLVGCAPADVPSDVARPGADWSASRLRRFLEGQRAQGQARRGPSLLGKRRIGPGPLRGRPPRHCTHRAGGGRRPCVSGPPAARGAGPTDRRTAGAPPGRRPAAGGNEPGRPCVAVAERDPLHTGWNFPRLPGSARNLRTIPFRRNFLG